MRNIPFSSEITDEQRNFASAVERELGSRNLVCRTQWGPDEGNGPCAMWHIPIRTELSDTLNITLYQDSLHFECGPCLASVEAASFGDSLERWKAGSLEIVSSLLDNPLRLRVRRRLLGRRSGAIFFAAPGGGGWSGELEAVRGRGEEVVYEEWY